MLTKVYNKGIRPIVYFRMGNDVKVIHPKKYGEFFAEISKGMIAKFPDAVSEKDFKKLMDKKTAPASTPEAAD